MTAEDAEDDALELPARAAAGRRTWGGATAQTVALTAVLAAAGTALAVRAPAEPLLEVDSGSWTIAIVLGLGAMFFLTELGQALVEVRRQAYSFSLSGVPLLIGLLYCPPGALIAARVVAAIAAFIVQRTSPLKVGYNAASYLLDVAAVIVLANQLTGGDAALTLRTAVLVYVSLAAVDLVMSCLVLVVIRINLGPVSRADVIEVIASASAFVVLNTAAGLICAILLGAGPLGGLLLVGFAVVTAVAYQAYLMLRRRHRSLEQVQEFIGTGEGAHTVKELAGRMLPHARELLRAARAELTLYDVDGRGTTVLGSADDGTMRIERGVQPGAYEVEAVCVRTETSLLLGERSHDQAARQFLDRRDVRDALIVPLVRSGTRGTLVVLDRLGDATRFTDDDLGLLQTLAGHLTVAVHGVQLLERLRYEATHDALTDLPNRALLNETMQSLLGRPREDGRAAVLLLDLDRFKEVNDALGHPVGDQLLQVIATRLRLLAPAGATVGRLGGDEFAVILPPSSDAEQDAVAVARSIADALRAPVELPDATVSTGASIGVAVAGDGLTDTDLLRHADTAMYAAKDSGVPVVVYGAELDQGLGERLSLLADLRTALDRDEIEVHYQPKLDLASDCVCSVEALVRWTHPTLGPIEPAGFVPLAESTGLIDQLTRVVLGKALRQCRAWHDAGHDLAVAVNLSARNVNDPTLPEQVAAALVAAGVPANRLILEITESAVMGDPNRTVPTLQRLAATGVTLSLDDFGTGYSSLSYLQRFPVRELKIDRAFILGLTEASEARASGVLVRSIIGLGRSLDLRVVAEGVETAEVLGQLRDLGCDIAQGYHIARPMPATHLPDAVRGAGFSTRRTASGQPSPSAKVPV